MAAVTGIPTDDVFGSHAKPTVEAPIPISQSLQGSGGATNTAITVVMTGASTGQIVVRQLFYSYSGIGAGKIQLGDAAGNIYFEQDVGSVQPGGLCSFRPKVFPQSTTAVATLAAIAAITGKLHVDGWMRL